MRRITDSEKAARLHEEATRLYHEAMDLSGRGQRKKAVKRLKACFETRKRAWEKDGKRPLWL